MVGRGRVPAAVVLLGIAFESTTEFRTRRCGVRRICAEGSMCWRFEGGGWVDASRATVVAGRARFPELVVVVEDAVSW